LLEQWLDDCEDLINHNEWGVALENLLENLYEIDFGLDEEAVNLAIKAIEENGFEYAEWRFIEELRR
jgi:hypothetical protein